MENYPLLEISVKHLMIENNNAVGHISIVNLYSNLVTVILQRKDLGSQINKDYLMFLMIIVEEESSVNSL